MDVIMSAQFPRAGVARRLLALGLLGCALCVFACASAHAGAAAPDPAASSTVAPAPVAMPGGGVASPLPQAAPAPPAAPGLVPQPAPVWAPLLVRLHADGLSGPGVSALFSSLPASLTQDPMGRKVRALYRRAFVPRPASRGKAPRLYEGVVTEANAARCRAYLREHAAAFAAAQQRYQVPPAVAVALLFVETRLGDYLGDADALYTLASMASCTTPASIPDWLVKLPGYTEHMDWLAETIQARSDWAYREVRALVAFMLDNGLAPPTPGSIYGAVGLCQFMPSNIRAYGVDGGGDGLVDLFRPDDAIASLAHYLYRHHWRSGLTRQQQHAVLKRYNNSNTYARTILALADVVQYGQVQPTPPKAEPKATGQRAKGKRGKATKARKAPRPAQQG